MMKRTTLTIGNIDEMEDIVIVEEARKLFIEVNENTEMHDFFIESDITLIEGECGQWYYPMHYYSEDIREAFDKENYEILGWDCEIIEKELL